MDTLSRRNLLLTAGLLPAASTAEAAPDPAEGQTRRKLRVIVAGGHPGDPEYGCGGTVARYVDEGDEVVLLYLNRGEWGYPETPMEQASAIRVAEATKACEILRVRPVYAGQLNGNAIVDKSHYEAFRKIIEAEKPDVLFTQWPIDGHPDHRAISMLAYDAWLKMGREFAFYYYEVSNGEDTLMFSPTEYVDISRTEPRKRAACYAHATQTPDRFYGLQTKVAVFRGIESGYTQAEGFIRHAQSTRHLLPGPA